jgi:hypothetical protein
MRNVEGGRADADCVRSAPNALSSATAVMIVSAEAEISDHQVREI